MDKKIAKALDRLNKEFYLKTQEYFNTSRQFYWVGWEKLLPYLKGQKLKVLDVGCGNGRFGKFLKEKDKKIDYMGIDDNQFLLDVAKKELPEAKIIKQDVLKKWLLKEKQDLVVIMGVMHHLALDDDREKIMRWAYESVKPDGIVFVSFWVFNLSSNFEKLKSDWNEVGIDEKKLDKNDYLLSWNRGVKAHRYCHLYDTKEIKKLVKTAKLEIIDDYIEDKSNRYLILKRKE